MITTETREKVSPVFGTVYLQGKIYDSNILKSFNLAKDEFATSLQLQLLGQMKGWRHIVLIEIFSTSKLTNLYFSRIEALNQYDAEKTRRESALNSLESYVFDVKTKLENEVEYKAAVTQNELESITKLYTEVGILSIFNELML